MYVNTRMVSFRTRLFSDLNNMSVNNLFNKNYVLLTSDKLTDFVEWVEKLNIYFEENGIEVLKSIYAVYISRLENKAQNTFRGCR